MSNLMCYYVNEVEKMIEKLLEMINSSFPLTEKDCGEFAKKKISGMDFNTKTYHAEGLGTVSTMCATGLMGLMKMDTLIVNPFNQDAPLLSYDHVLGNDKLYLESFDTTLNHQFDDSSLVEIIKQASSISDMPQKPHWYDNLRMPATAFKQAKKKQSDQIDQMVENYYKQFIVLLKNAEKCDEDEKRKAAAVYSDGLIEHGGPSTDAWLKAVGPEKTGEFFRKVLFGTDK